MNYYKEYIKYKLKYYKLKNIQIGGDVNYPLNKTIINYNNNNFIVYDDSKLIGGTKTRLLNKLLPRIKEKEIIYAGPSTGLAQVALAYTAKKYNKKATIFLSNYDPDKPELVNLAKKFGAKIIFPKVNSLQYVQKVAEKYVLKKKIDI